MPFLTKLISTFFYIGYCRYWSGTLASVAGVVIFYFLRARPLWVIIAAAVCTALGFIFAGRAERLLGRKDASPIVIDEVAGMLICFIFVPYSVSNVVIGFILFRIFDIFKIYPAGPLQELKGSAGIMCDDIAAALYTNIILQLMVRIF